MTRYQDVLAALRAMPRQWLITGGAGFIGSHVAEVLLEAGQRVRILDDLFTGKATNVEGLPHQDRLEWIQGDIRDAETCSDAMREVDTVIHLAALGSVPLSMEQPMLCHEINVTGTLQVFLAAKEAGVKRIAYASSSAVYGDDPAARKVEDQIGSCLSPYAASKRMNEVYAQTLHTSFGLEAIGLRFFNVFGPRQDPNGAYAAVIPQWIAAMRDGRDVFINGDGHTSRDFCFVRDIVQALILAATTEEKSAFGDAFNVGLGKATSLNELFDWLQGLVSEVTGQTPAPAIHRDFRPGDIQHSCADDAKIRRVLGFAPAHTVAEGLRETVLACCR